MPGAMTGGGCGVGGCGGGALTGSGWRAEHPACGASRAGSTALGSEADPVRLRPAGRGSALGPTSRSTRYGQRRAGCTPTRSSWKREAVDHRVVGGRPRDVAAGDGGQPFAAEYHAATRVPVVVPAGSGPGSDPVRTRSVRVAAVGLEHPRSRRLPWSAPSRTTSQRSGSGAQAGRVAGRRGSARARAGVAPRQTVGHGPVQVHAGRARRRRRERLRRPGQGWRFPASSARSRGSSSRSAPLLPGPGSDRP